MATTRRAIPIVSRSTTIDGWTITRGEVDRQLARLRAAYDAEPYMYDYQEPTVGEALSRAVERRICTARGSRTHQVVNSRRFSRHDGSTTWMLTIGRPAPAGDGARWTSCQEVALTWDDQEVADTVMTLGYTS